MKQIILCLLFSLLAVMFSIAQKPQVFQTEGKAIHGYDVIAFYTQSKAVKGNEQISYKWNDAVWLFSDSVHLENFKTDPVKYVPQYGGYCAYGAANGYKAPTAPDTWTILNGKLYFNYNQQVKDMWSKKTSELIPKADGNWEKIKAQ